MPWRKLYQHSTIKAKDLINRVANISRTNMTVEKRNVILFIGYQKQRQEELLKRQNWLMIESLSVSCLKNMIPKSNIKALVYKQELLEMNGFLSNFIKYNITNPEFEYTMEELERINQNTIQEIKYESYRCWLV